MIPQYLDMAWVGGAAGLVALLCQLRRLEKLWPLGVALVAGVAAWRWVIDPAWVWDSVRQDVPWGSALLLAFWGLQARLGWLRVEGWVGAVLGGVLVGDLAVAGSLAMTEPDPVRRARLVLAASGASLIGRTGGAAPLLLGWGGGTLVVLGLLLALVGFTDVKKWGISVQKPSLAGAWPALFTGFCGALIVWLLITAGLLEFAAGRIEVLPVKLPAFGRWIVTAVGLVVGAVVDEGVGAMAASETLLRALSLREDWARQSLLSGITVGGGLPLLLLTRSSLRVGLPLWLLQVGVLAAWIWWR